MPKKREICKLNIVESVESSRLGFRSSAAELFKQIETLPTNRVEINFQNVKFISRSFAHEYLQRKHVINKRIVEKQMPKNIEQMFQIVINSKEKPKIQRKIQQTISI